MDPPLCSMWVFCRIQVSFLFALYCINSKKVYNKLRNIWKTGNRNILWIAYILAGTDAGIVTGMAGLSAAVVITPLRDYNSDESFGSEA